MMLAKSPNMKPHPGSLFLAALALLGTTAFSDLGAKATPAEGGPRKPAAPQPTWLGVAIVEASAEISAKLAIEPGTGLVVEEVKPASPAAIAGLQRNDVLARLNEQTLTTPAQLKTLVSHRKPGTQVELTFFIHPLLDLRAEDLFEKLHACGGG